MYFFIQFKCKALLFKSLMDSPSFHTSHSQF